MAIFDREEGKLLLIGLPAYLVLKLAGLAGQTSDRIYAQIRLWGDGDLGRLREIGALQSANGHNIGQRAFTLEQLCFELICIANEATVRVAFAHLDEFEVELRNLP